MGIPRAEVSIDEEMVRELLRAQHPDLAELTLAALPSGWDNAMFRLGEHLAIRLPRRELAAALILNEQRWLPQVAPALPLKVPVPVRVGVPQDRYPWSWSIVPWVEGETAEFAALDGDQGETLAEFFEALHRPAPAEAPRNPYRGVPLQQREPHFRDRVAKLHGRSHAIDTAVSDLWAKALAAPVGATATWIHGDLHPRNILCVRGRIEGVIDWGDMAQGDRASDLAAVWMLLPTPEARGRAMAACPTACCDTWARAKGWAALYAAIFLDAALESDPGMAAIAERTLARLKQDP
jgi:aminoglycoside phosphotransferase (APT) family kinase protein